MTSASYILLVDDEPYNLRLLEELLALEGYNTRSAKSGAEALEYAQASRPELILLDVMMPDMDGFEVCEQLRADALLQTVPVIFLTALSDDASRLKGLAAMGDDYITKPLNVELMLTKIASLLRLRQLRQAAYKEQIEQQVQALQQAQVQARQQMSAALKINEALSEKFRLFVPEQFLQRIAPQGPETIQLGNAIESEVTVLFCDIRDFTAIAEMQSAQETFIWLNRFFTTINQAIENCHGFVDKYLGDAVMAVFDRTQHHASDGLSAVIQISPSLGPAQPVSGNYQFNRSHSHRHGPAYRTGCNGYSRGQPSHGHNRSWRRGQHRSPVGGADQSLQLSNNYQRRCDSTAA